MDKLEEAIKLLGDINPEVRKQAVRDLGDIRDVRAVDPLLPVCNDKDVEVRRIAIEALGKIGDARAILCMGRTYLGKGPSHRYDCPVIDLREAKEEDKLFIAQAILQIGPSAVDVLIDIVENQGGYDYYHPANSYICWQVALLALWMSRDVRAVEVINRLLEHKDPHVRGRFVGFLERRTENRARAFLVSALDNNDKEVRVNAAKALGIPYTIKVIGVGGAGKYALNRMIDTRLYCVEFIAMDFYPDCLAESKAANKLLMEQTHRNWPIGEFGELSRICKHESALDGREQIRRAIGKASIVLIVAGMGGGTGSGVAPVIAETARETGALTIGVITTPFTFEGQGAHRLANKGIEELLNHVDTLIAISDAAIEKTFGNNKVSVNEAFQAADDYLRLAVRCIVRLIIAPYLCPLGSDRVPTLLRSETGRALIGNMAVAYASGENRAIDAAKMVIASPLLERPVKDARVVLMDLRVVPDFHLYEVGNAVDIIADGTDKNAEVIWDTSMAQNPTNEIEITTICLYNDSEDKTVV